MATSDDQNSNNNQNDFSDTDSPNNFLGGNNKTSQNKNKQASSDRDALKFLEENDQDLKKAKQQENLAWNNLQADKINYEKQQEKWGWEKGQPYRDLSGDRDADALKENMEKSRETWLEAKGKTIAEENTLKERVAKEGALNINAIDGAVPAKEAGNKINLDPVSPVGKNNQANEGIDTAAFAEGSPHHHGSSHHASRGNQEEGISKQKEDTGPTKEDKDRFYHLTHTHYNEHSRADRASMDQLRGIKEVPDFVKKENPNWDPTMNLDQYHRSQKEHGKTQEQSNPAPDVNPGGHHHHGHHAANPQIEPAAAVVNNPLNPTSPQNGAKDSVNQPYNDFLSGRGGDLSDPNQRNSIYDGIKSGLEGNQKDNQLAVEGIKKWQDQTGTEPSAIGLTKGEPIRTLSEDIRSGAIQPTKEAESMYQQSTGKNLPGTGPMTQSEIAHADQRFGFEASNYQNGTKPGSLDSMQVQDNNGSAPRQSSPVRPEDTFGPTKINAAARMGDRDMLMAGIKESLPVGKTFEGIRNSPGASKMLEDIAKNPTKEEVGILKELTHGREEAEKFAKDASVGINPSLKDNNMQDRGNHSINLHEVPKNEYSAIIAGSSTYDTARQQGLSPRDAGATATNSAKAAYDISTKNPTLNPVAIGTKVGENSVASLQKQGSPADFAEKLKSAATDLVSLIKPQGPGQGNPLDPTAGLTK
jgi:hypothetical protein